MAMTACFGEILYQLDLLVGEGTNFLAKIVIAPMSSSSFSIGTQRPYGRRPDRQCNRRA